MLDYTEVFNKEKNELVAKGYLPVKPGINDDENQLVINELTDRIQLLEKAIEELRIRKHAVENAKDERKSALSSQRRKAQDEADMNDRQKKQVDKIDRQVNVKRLQAQELEKTLRDIGMSDEEIKATLIKKGLMS